ncbi:MAG: PQQ-dependent sugar dehydrogenase [Blastocatellia bacterium]
MRKFLVRFSCVLLLAAAAWFSANRFASLNDTASAQATIQLITVLTGMNNPVYLTNARDGSNRLFILEQPGRIRILPPGATSPLSTAFLDIVSKVSSGGERGLLGLAFHPQYTTNRRFFVNYTRTGDGATVVSEFKVSASNPNVAETEERIILTVAQPFSNHNGGWIDFGPDGFLYIGMGDGGSANDPGNRAQNVEDLLGKILRIDVNTTDGSPYTSPATNPFFGSTPGRDEIYATGLRNPWRCAFDRATGQLYAGDFGQGVIEEISVITLGGNFGWRVFEGTRCTNNDPTLCTASNYIMPLAEYNHSGGRCSVTGGYVYRGNRGSLPVGSYVFADYCSGEIFLFNNNAMSMLLDTNFQIASFGEDEAGEIYVVSLGGSILRIASPVAATAVSAANYSGGGLAPESIAAAFGQNFSTVTQAAPNNQSLPTTLAGASVRVTDATGTARSSQLFFVSPTQINFMIPPGTATGAATIAFTNTNGAISTGAVNVANVAPGLFTANASGRGIAAAVALRIKADGSQTFESIARFDQAQNQFVMIPIDLGAATDQVFLVTFGTGFRFRSSLGAVNATIGGTAAQVNFAGAQGTLIGLDQANILIPRSLIGRGEVDVVFTVDGQPSNNVRASIR